MKSLMKRRIMSVILVAIMVLSFGTFAVGSGCKSSSDSADSSSTNSNANSNANSNGSSAQLSSGSGVTGGGAEYNGQAGGGYMYQINYSDGNFRQYDTKTGELIGSTFDEDQEKLGNINGEML